MSIDATLELLQQGLPLEEVVQRMRSSDDREVVRRIALLRRFDPDGFAIALGRGTDEARAALAGPLARGEVRQPQPTHEVYITTRELREDHRRAWDVTLELGNAVVTGPDGPEFRGLHSALAEHFARLGSDWVLETLHHRLAADPEQGIAQMEQLMAERLPGPGPLGGASDAHFAGASDGIALSRAMDVIDVANEQLTYVPMGLKERYTRAHGLVQSWVFWLDDWLRTRRYIDRQVVHDWLIALESPGAERRILEVTAPGGSGKTMSLRWLITHHCLPRRLPVAHLDFDRFAGRRLSAWQLLLRCAEQLSLQLDGAPYSTLLMEGRHLEQGLATAQPDGAQLAAVASYFPERFAGVLNSYPAAVVTLVVDTLEEGMALGSAPLAELLSVLIRCLQMAPSLRLILCGRYPLTHLDFETALRDRHPVEHAFYSAQKQHRRLPLFDRQEARQYLQTRLEKRDIRLDDGRFERLFEAAARIGRPPGDTGDPEVFPFHLALIADLLDDAVGDDLPIETLIREIAHVQVIYLIERVIRRVPDVGVRWLIRYGVVPRRLTRDFFQQVMLPYLQRINHTGRSQDDDPAMDNLPEPLQEESLYFQDSEVFAEGEAAAWARLRRFAAPDSWVIDDGDALRFHVSVREPMRALLRQHPVLRQIHEDAARYFSGRADGEADPLARASDDCNAIYHAFQGETAPAAIDQWRALVGRRLDAEDFHSVLSLATDVRGADYVTESGRMLDGQGLADALSLAALAALDLADLAGSETDEGQGRLVEADQAIAALRAMPAAASGSRTALLEAMAQVRKQPRRRPQLLEAIQTLASSEQRWTMGPARSLDLRGRALRGLATARAAIGDSRCVDDYAMALAARGADEPDPPPMTRLLVCSLARCLGRYGGNEKALGLLRRHLDRPEIQAGRPPDMAWSALTLLEQWMHRQTAARLAEPLTASPDGTRDRLVLGGDLRSFPARAVEHFQQRWEGDASQLSGSVAGGELLQAVAEAHVLLCDPLSAQALLREAAGTYRDAGRPDQAAACDRAEARLWLRHHRNFARTEQALGSYDRTWIATSGNAISEDRLLSLEMALRLRPEQEAATGLDELLEAARQEPDMARQLDLLSLLLAFPRLFTQREPQVERFLLEVFERLPDAIARSRFPWRLREGVQGVALGDEATARLRDLMVPPHANPLFRAMPPAPEDRAWAQLALAQLLRTIGLGAEALAFTRAAGAWLQGIASLTGLREVWHLYGMLGAELPDPSALDAFEGSPPLLLQTIAVEQAEHGLARGDSASARRWVERVELASLREQPSWLAPRALTLHARFADDESATLGLLTEARQVYLRLGDRQAAALFEPWLQGSAERLETALAAAEAHPVDPTDPRSVLRGLRRRDALVEADAADTATIPDFAVILRGLGHEIPSELSSEADTLVASGAWLSTTEDLLRTLADDELAGARQTASEQPERASREIARALRTAWGSDTETAPYAAVSSSAELPSGLARIAAMLLTLPAPSSETQRQDLCIAGASGVRASLPWELARCVRPDWPRERLLYRAVQSPDQPVRWLQQVMSALTGGHIAVDGRFGARTRAMMRDLMEGAEPLQTFKQRIGAELARHRRGNAPIQALILQGTRERESASRRGIDYYGADLTKLYQDLGIQVTVERGLDLDNYATEVPFRPALIHLYAPYTEDPSLGRVDVDLGFGRRKGGRSQPEMGAVPLLILDGPGEPDPAEHMRQVFLRNAFAEQMAARGDFQNVLALGLDRYPRLDLLRALIEEALAGKPLRHLYDRLTQLRLEGLGGLEHHWPERTGELAPALWTSDPDLSLLLWP